MLSSLLTDMCLDTINSTTKFSPVISRCNFAGVNGMSLHLQTEKLESITLSWQLSAARLLRCSSPGESGALPAGFILLPPHHSPAHSRSGPARPLLPPEILPPRPRGDGAAPPSHGTLAPGRAGSRCQPRPEPPLLTASALRLLPVSPGGRGRPAAPSRPSPAHGGQRRSPGKRRAAAGRKLTWG